MSHSITAHLYDLSSNFLADISPICLEKTLHRRHNMVRGFTIESFAGHSLFSSIVAGDGLRNLRKGNRKLVVWEDGGPGDQPIFHGRVRTVERTGDGQKNRVKIGALCPLMELGYAGDDQAGRPLRDGTGNFITPVFNAGGPISGPDLIFQGLTNSINADPTMGEGALPIAFDIANFDIDTPPAVDLACTEAMDFPIMLGDFVQMLIATGVVDIDLRPLDIGESDDPYAMVDFSAKSLIGTNRSGSVHFDYWTGSFNAAEARHLEDWTTICNKLFDYLGIKLDPEHFPGNITPTAPEHNPTGVPPHTGRDWPDITGDSSVADSIAASRALYGGPDSGQMMVIRQFDSLGTENENREIYINLWLGEHRYRVEPRDMIFITPAMDDHGLFTAPQDFDCGDLITVKTGAPFGIALNEAQRVYGYDKTWDRQNVARLSELIASRDAE